MHHEHKIALYLHNHLDFFTENRVFIEEQCERFNQDIETMDEIYQGHWDAHMMAYCFWILKRDFQGISHSRKSSKRRGLCVDY